MRSDGALYWSNAFSGISEVSLSKFAVDTLVDGERNDLSVQCLRYV